MTNHVSVSASSHESPAHALLAMMLGAAQTQLLSVAAQLRLADLIQAGTTSITDLAAATGTSVPVLSRVMPRPAPVGAVCGNRSPAMHLYPGWGTLAK
jgi:hypothetical protein